MKNVCFALIAATIHIGASAVSAQATRTWVSGSGNDSNPCSRTLPCQTFAGALSKTLAGGEISALDPGGFGSVTIDKAITINGDGTLASIVATNTGVTINAGVNDKVVLRNLSINGAGTALSGIRYIAGKDVIIENCSIAGFTNYGIEIALASNGTLSVNDTNISNNGIGIQASTANGFLARVSLDNVNIESSSTHGIVGGFSSRIIASNSVISGNTSSGVLANSATTRITLTTCRVSFNGTGINAAIAGSIIRLSDNDIGTNITGVAAGAGTIETAGNNRTSGNNATMPLGAPTITVE